MTSQELELVLSQPMSLSAIIIATVCMLGCVYSIARLVEGRVAGSESSMGWIFPMAAFFISMFGSPVFGYWLDNRFGW